MVGISPKFNEPGAKVKWGYFVFGTVIMILYMLSLFVLIGLFINNMNFSDRFTHLSQFGTSYKHSGRYGTEWGFIYAMLVMNLIQGYLLAFAICNNGQPLWSKSHLWFSGLTLFANFIFFVTFGILWLFFCNTGYSQGSPCNDDRWCCEHYVDKPEWCQNVVNCGGSVSLSRTGEWFAVFMYSWILIVCSWIHRSVNKLLRQHGMFVEEK
jgi:hypothetical protein